MIVRLRQQLSEKRTKLAQMLASFEGREDDLTADEQKPMDDLMAQIEDLTARVEKLEKAQGMADGDEPPADQAGRGRRSTPIGSGSGPAIHTGERAIYSFRKAIGGLADAMQGFGRFDGLELEVHQEIARRTGRKSDGGLFAPLGNDPEIRRLAYGKAPERRANFDTGTAAGNLFNEVGGPLIELLRNQIVVKQMGASVLSDMIGLFAIPRQTGQATIYWTAENNSATLSSATTDQVAFSPKQAIAVTKLTRTLLNQSSIDAELLVRNDLVETMGVEADRVAINGSGTTQPLGILQIPGIQSKSSALAIGTNGGALTWAKVLAMETQVASYNAVMGNKMAYLGNSKIRGQLKNTTKVPSSTTPTFVWEDGKEYGDGKVNNYPAWVTNNVPSTLTKASGSGLSAFIFGNWKDLYLSFWEGLEILVNPFTYQTAGEIAISVRMAMDVQVRHEESFACIYDVQA